MSPLVLRLTLLGSGLLLPLLLGLQLSRGIAAERERRALEVERAVARATELLVRARRSPEVLDELPADTRFRFSDGALAFEEDVGWLWQKPTDAMRDLVVDDRLARAQRQEFDGEDAPRIAQAYDELLAGPLGRTSRARVLGAAAFHARRAGLAERARKMEAALGEILATTRPSELGDPDLAGAIAALARLEPDPSQPGHAVVARLGTFVPAELLTGSAAGVGTWREDLSRRTQRRATLQTVDRTLRVARDERGVALAGGGVLPVDARRFVWWLPERNGSTVGALVDPSSFVDAVQRAGERGALASWPELAEVAPADISDTAHGIPGLGPVRPAEATADEATLADWLPAALTWALLGVFVAVAFHEVRTSRREALAVAAHSEFLTSVTHELRTPLASIRLLAEMLAEGRARDRAPDYHRMLVAESARLSMLIENVLDLGRTERGARALDLQSTDVRALVEETVALVAVQADAEGRAIQLDIATDAPVRARVDRAALAQALVAVLDNARKYGEGSIEVSVQRSAPGSGPVVRVRDRGRGVSPDERESIFARFERGRAHRDGSKPGLGIGLYLARTLLRRMGGDLACVDPSDGPGAVFVFHLPHEANA
jgi:signal transduction histidine kinase